MGTSESSSPSVIGHGGSCTCWCSLCCRWHVQKMRWRRRRPPSKRQWRTPKQTPKLGDLEESAAALQVEKERLYADLQAESERLSEVEDKLAQETNERSKLEFALNEAIEKLEGEAHSAKTFLERNNKQKKEIDELSAKIDEG